MKRLGGTLGLISIGICLIALFQAPWVQAGTIELSIPDTCASPGEALWLPVYTTDVTDSGVYGYNLVIKYDSTFIGVDSVTSDGTISAVWGGGGLLWNVVEGEDSLRIADFGIVPLVGEGVLVRIRIVVLASAPVDSSTEVSIPVAMMRDDPGKPPTLTHPGVIVIPCTAGIEPEAEEAGTLRINRLGPSKVRWNLNAAGLDAGRLVIYDPAGRFVAAIEPHMGKGSATYLWNGQTCTGSLASGGVYFYKLAAGDRVWKGKIRILR